MKSAAGSFPQGKLNICLVDMASMPSDGSAASCVCYFEFRAVKIS